MIPMTAVLKAVGSRANSIILPVTKHYVAASNASTFSFDAPQ